MSEKHLVCKGATVYCDKSVAANNPREAISLNITSQALVEFNGGKVAATDKDNQALNMNFGFCTKSNPPTPCTANIQWMKTHPGAEVTANGGKLLTEESEGICSCGGGKVKVAFHGQVATPQGSDIDIVSLDLLSRILPVNPTLPKIKLNIAPPSLKKKEGKILSIEILDDSNRPITDDYTKFVNLPAQPRFVNNSDIKGRYQLGPNIRCRVKFDGAGVHKFKLEVVGGSGNLSYTDTEIGGNDAFKIKYPEEELETGLNGEIIIDNIFLSQAGGNKYYLKATDSANKVVKSVKITTWRKLYYVEMKMAGLTSIANSLQMVTKEFKKHFIALEKLGEDVTIPHIRNIDNNGLNNFKNSVTTEYANHNRNNNSMDPYCIAIAYTDHLAVKRYESLTIPPVNVGPRVENILLPITHRGVTYSLWYDIDDQPWFVSCSFTSSKTGRPININADNITVGTNKQEVSINVSNLNLTEDEKKNSGSITLTVNVVETMRGGFSFNNTNIIAVCTRVFWQNVTTSDQNQVIIHELGHQIGMVPAPESDDKKSKYYTDHGHRGPHCYRGLGTLPDTFANISLSDLSYTTCVMFGAINRQSAFCNHCAKCVKKLDLSK